MILNGQLNTQLNIKGCDSYVEVMLFKCLKLLQIAHLPIVLENYNNNSMTVSILAHAPR